MTRGLSALGAPSKAPSGQAAVLATVRETVRTALALALERVLVLAHTGKLLVELLLGSTGKVLPYEVPMQIDAEEPT